MFGIFRKKSFLETKLKVKNPRKFTKAIQEGFDLNRYQFEWLNEYFQDKYDSGKITDDFSIMQEIGEFKEDSYLLYSRLANWRMLQKPPRFGKEWEQIYRLYDKSITSSKNSSDSRYLIVIPKMFFINSWTKEDEPTEDDIRRLERGVKIYETHYNMSPRRTRTRWSEHIAWIYLCMLLYYCRVNDKANFDKYEKLFLSYRLENSLEDFFWGRNREPVCFSHEWSSEFTRHLLFTSYKHYAVKNGIENIGHGRGIE